MIKRITKLTGLMACAASIISLVPAYAADVQKVDAQDGTTYSAKAKGNGIFIDGEVNGADEACYWISDDGKYNKLDDVDTGSTMTDELMNKYLEIDTGAKDFTYVDITDGYKEVDYDVRDDLESTVATTLKGKLRHDNNDRFADNFDKDLTTFKGYYNRETTTDGKKVGFVSGSDGLSVFQIPLKDNLDSGISNDVTSYSGTLDNNSSYTFSNTDAIYADATGNYVDADYNLGSVKVYEGTTTGASVTLNNTKDSYDFKDYELKAVLQEGKGYIAEVGDTVYRWANLTIYKSTDHGKTYSPVTTSDNLTFGGDAKDKVGYIVNGTIPVLQSFSKTAASDTVDGIKYSKDSTIYFVADKKGVDKTKSLLALNGGKMKASAKALCSFLGANGTIKAETVTPSHKNSFNYLDIGDQDSSDYDSTSIADAGGIPYFTNSGAIMTWDGDHSFVKFAKVDAGLDNISTGSSTKVALWNSDKDIYSVINVPKAATGTTAATGTATTSTSTTTGAAATVSTTVTNGWTKNSDNTWSYLENGTKKTGWLKDGSAWYYLKSDGIMATGWINDNGTWYYLDPSGAMKTGWINDNGAWYYCTASGNMLSSTVIDGYTLGADGAWIQ